MPRTRLRDHDDTIRIKVGVGLGGGGRGSMVTWRGGDSPPPVGGVKTVTWAVPAAATSAAVSWAVSRVALTKAVGRSAPFQRDVERRTKPVPSTVRAALGDPATGRDSAAMSGAAEIACQSASVSWTPMAVKVSLICAPPPDGTVKSSKLPPSKRL